MKRMSILAIITIVMMGVGVGAACHWLCDGTAYGEVGNPWGLPGVSPDICALDGELLKFEGDDAEATYEWTLLDDAGHELAIGTVSGDRDEKFQFTADIEAGTYDSGLFTVQWSATLGDEGATDPCVASGCFKIKVNAIDECPSLDDFCEDTEQAAAELEVVMPACAVAGWEDKYDYNWVLKGPAPATTEVWTGTGNPVTIPAATLNGLASGVYTLTVTVSKDGVILHTCTITFEVYRTVVTTVTVG